MVGDNRSGKPMQRQTRKLGRTFYGRPAAELAPALIGKVLVRRMDGQEYRVQIVEAEAYCGPQDLACHTSKGRTRRNEVMFGPPGHAYVYFIYGMYDMFNIVSGPRGGGQAVLIRAAEAIAPFQADLSGPGKLTRALQITRSDNGRDLIGDELFVTDGSPRRPRILVAKRVGVDYAGKWKDALLRFCDADSRFVSKPRPNCDRQP